MLPGIHENVPMADYIALKALSSGLCHILLSYSPEHAKYEQDNSRHDDNEASEIGTAIHDVLLEGRDRIVPVAAENWRTTAAKEAREFARAQGGIPLLARKVAHVEAAIKAAKEFVATSEIRGVFDTGKSEQTIIWVEESFNKDKDRFGMDMLCKARPDWLTADHSMMLHVKTTAGSAEPNNWIRNQLVPMGYDFAAMFYERGMHLLTGDVARTVFLIVEQQPPHGCSLVGLSPAMQELASRKVERAIRVWRECQMSGKYYCYSSRIAYAEPMSWQMAAEDERELHDFELGGQA